MTEHKVTLMPVDSGKVGVSSFLFDFTFDTGRSDSLAYEIDFIDAAGRKVVSADGVTPLAAPHLFRGLAKIEQVPTYPLNTGLAVTARITLLENEGAPGVGNRLKPIPTGGKDTTWWCDAKFHLGAGSHSVSLTYTLPADQAAKHKVSIVRAGPFPVTLVEAGEVQLLDKIGSPSTDDLNNSDHICDQADFPCIPDIS